MTRQRMNWISPWSTQCWSNFDDLVVALLLGMPSPNEFNDYTFLKRFTSNPTEPLWMMSIILQTINCAIAWNSCICSSWCRPRHQKICRNHRLLRNVTFPFTFFAVLFTNGHRLHRNEGHRTVREIPAKRSHFISIRLGIFSVINIGRRVSIVSTKISILHRFFGLSCSLGVWSRFVTSSLFRHGNWTACLPKLQRAWCGFFPSPLVKKVLSFCPLPLPYLYEIEMLPNNSVLITSRFSRPSTPSSLSVCWSCNNFSRRNNNWSAGGISDSRDIRCFNPSTNSSSCASTLYSGPRSLSSGPPRNRTVSDKNRLTTMDIVGPSDHFLQKLLWIGNSPRYSIVGDLRSRFHTVSISIKRVIPSKENA